MLKTFGGKLFRLFAVVLSAAVVAGCALMFTACSVRRSEISVRISFNGEEYTLNYVLYRDYYRQTVDHFMALIDEDFFDNTVIHDYRSDRMVGGGYTYEDIENGDITDDLTALDLPWEIVLTTATNGEGQLQLQLNNTSETPSGVNLEAALTLSAAFEKLDPADDTDARNKLLAYVKGNDVEGNVAERYADKSGDLIGEVINSVLSSRLTLELGADSNGDTFDLKYALNGLLGLLGMDKIDTDLAFNLDTSADMKYRLNLILDGQRDDLSAINAYIGIEMASGNPVGDSDWETAIGIYLSEGEIYVDLSAIRKGALGGGVLKVANSAIMELFETEINKLLSNINLDLNKLLTLNYKPINPPVEEVSTAPSLTVNEMPVGTLVSYLIQMVSLKNLGVALDAHTTLLKDFTRELFGYAIDFVEAEGNLLLVDGKLDLSVKIASDAFADDTVTDKPDNVYTLGAVLDISRGTDISDKITAVKEKPTTEIDLSNGASLAWI